MTQPFLKSPQEWHFFLSLFHWQCWSKPRGAGMPLPLISTRSKQAQSPRTSRRPRHKPLPHGDGSLQPTKNHPSLWPSQGQHHSGALSPLCPGTPSHMPAVGSSSAGEQPGHGGLKEPRRWELSKGQSRATASPRPAVTHLQELGADFELGCCHALTLRRPLALLDAAEEVADGPRDDALLILRDVHVEASAHGVGLPRTSLQRGSEGGAGRALPGSALPAAPHTAPCHPRLPKRLC